MFGLMEEAKKQFDIEDYSISQTSLEKIFLAFAMHQKVEITKPKNITWA